MRLGWLSDIHLDCLEDDSVEEFFEGVASRETDGWLIGGDIGLASSVTNYLGRLAAIVRGPIYFVLGNHDFYGSSMEAVHSQVRRLVRSEPRLVWLTGSGVHECGPVSVVGDDGWADARLGDALGTSVELNDFYLIRDLSGLSRPALVRKLEALGDAAAARLEPKLREAATKSRDVLVLTHVPPFRESAWYDGRPSSDEYLPWFSCRAVGDALLSCAAAYPAVRFLVLCGHTHGAGTYAPAGNMTVRTARATYGEPSVQAVFELGERLHRD